MIAPEILEAMKDAGASVEVILAAIRADAALADKALEERRAKDRERQRRHRMSRSVTVTPRDTRDPSPNERDNLTPTREEKPKPKGLVKKSDRGSRLPADWEPRALTGKALAMVAAWQPGAIERELAKFKNYWLAKGANAARTDWQRTWVNWLISADERTPRTNFNERSDPLLTALGKFQQLAGGVGAGAGTGKNAQTGGARVDVGSGSSVVARFGGGRA